MTFFNNKKIEKNTPVPLYYQLKNLIIECSKDKPNGYILPTTQEIMAHFNISDTTVRQAMLELVKENYVKRKKGIGTVLNRQQRNVNEIYKNISSMQLYAPIDFGAPDAILADGTNYCIGICLNQESTPFYTALKKILQQKLSASRIRYIILNAAGDKNLQLEQIQSLIKKNVDMIVVNPCSPDHLNNIMTRLSDLNIPVISMDGHLSSNAPFLTHIGCDNYQIGLRIGIYAAGYFKRHLEIEKITLGIIEGPEDNLAGKDREAGFLSGLHELYPDDKINIVFHERGDWTKQSGYNAVKNHLEIIEKVDLIYSYSDNMALGSIQFLKENKIDNVLFAGVDGSSAALEMLMEKGPILAIGINNPAIIASLTANMVIKFLKTNSLPSRNIMTEPIVITRENVHNYIQEKPSF